MKEEQEEEGEGEEREGGGREGSFIMFSHRLRSMHQKDSSLQGRQRAFTRHQGNQQLDLQFPNIRTMRKHLVRHPA